MTNSASPLGFDGVVRRTWNDGGFQIDHCHDELEFNLVIGGEGIYILDDGEYSLQPGALVWLLPGQMHRLVRSADLDMWVVATQPRLWDATLLGDVAEYPARVLGSDDVAMLDRLFTQISQDADEPGLYNAGLAYAVQSARRASRNAGGPRRGPLHPLIARALALLRGETPPASLEDLARACGSTGSHIGRLLMQQTGSGYVEWRNRARLERFHVVYRDSEGLLEAALEAGFGSYVQFHRVFVEMVGCTPGEWAKAGANTDRIASSSAGALMARLDTGLRMDWYGLARLVLPATRTWVDDAFRKRLLASLPATPGPRPATGYDRSLADHATVRADLVDGLRDGDAEGAALLAQAFARYDIMAAFDEAARFWNFNSADVADTIAAYLTIAWNAANKAPGPRFDDVQALRRRTAAALTAAGGFHAAGQRERQTVAKAFIAQAMFLNNAWHGARNSSDITIVDEISAVAQAGALRIFGIDLRATRLDFPAP